MSVRGWCMLEGPVGVCVGGVCWVPVGGLVWGKRFCDESKMVDVDAFCCVNRLSKCCFAALCSVLFCPMLLLLWL
ncbi:hypothetical protein [Bartonella sp. TT29SHDZB]|uniref:hypothetical protein n=1 Tax=Bartonella sp. TT29SHDZB TaxID=3243581 RepID=UPI0035D09347